MEDEQKFWVTELGDLGEDFEQEEKRLWPGRISWRSSLDFPLEYFQGCVLLCFPCFTSPSMFRERLIVEKRRDKNTWREPHGFFLFLLSSISYPGKTASSGLGREVLLPQCVKAQHFLAPLHTPSYQNYLAAS